MCGGKETGRGGGEFFDLFNDALVAESRFIETRSCLNFFFDELHARERRARKFRGQEREREKENERRRILNERAFDILSAGVINTQ